MRQAQVSAVLQRGVELIFALSWDDRPRNAKQKRDKADEMRTRRLLTTAVVMALLITACSENSPGEESKAQTKKQAEKQPVASTKPAAGRKTASPAAEAKASQQARCREAYRKTVVIQKKQIALTSNPVLKEKFKQSLQKLYKIKGEFHQLCMSKDEQKMQVLEKIIEEKQKLLR